MSDKAGRDGEPPCARCGGTGNYDWSPPSSASTAGMPCPRCCARRMLKGDRLTVWIGKRGERQWFANEVETERRDLASGWPKWCATWGQDVLGPHWDPSRSYDCPGPHEPPRHSATYQPLGGSDDG